MSRWHWFFAIAAVLIVVTEMIPQAFGLNSLTQWGGMYIDAWCHVTLGSAPLPDPSAPVPPAPLEREDILAGSRPQPRLVWFAPMHNPESCTHWARSFCGYTAPEGGFRIASAYPYFRGEWLTGNENVCEHPETRWFRRHE